MSKIWEWLKTNWRWLVLPLWLASMLLTWLFTRGGTLKKPEPSGTTDQAANNAVNSVISAAGDKDTAIQKLEVQYQGKIDKMSADQKAEWEKVKTKPVEEVAAWIDKF